jgi:hypothetical protein
MMKMMKRLCAGILIIVSGTLLYAQEGVGAYIREYTGTVEVKAPGEADWKAAEPGQQISRDTVISTGFKSTALIVLGNSTLTVRPLTRLSLEEIQNRQGDESVRLDLQTGRVRAEVNPPSGGKIDFTVHSPTATASVRGTTFEFNGMNLNVFEGVVHVSGGDRTGVYVGAGHRAVTDPWTGRTAGAGEMVKAELTPALPETAAESVPAPSAITPAANTPTAGDADVGFDWN